MTPNSRGDGMAENDTRIETLEDEVKVLKGEVKRTLVDLRALLMREDSPLTEAGFSRTLPRGLRRIHPHEFPDRGQRPIPLLLRWLLRLSLRRPRPIRFPVRDRGQAPFQPVRRSKPLRVPDPPWPGWPRRSGGWRIRNGV